MEEKKRFPRLRKWLRNIGLALGITASTLSLGTEKANAQEINSDTGKSKTPVEEKIEQDNYANTKLAQTNLDKLFAENARLNSSSADFNKSSADKFSNATKSVDDSATKASNVAKSINNTISSIGNLKSSRDLGSTINNVKNIQSNIERIDENLKNADTSIQQADKAVSQVLSTDKAEFKSEDNKEQTIENKEIKETPVIEEKTVETKSEEKTQTNSSITNQELAKKMIDGAHLSAIKAYPDDREEALADEIVSLKRQISEARYNDNSELASILVAKHDELLKERYDLTVERLSKSQNPEQVTNLQETKEAENSEIVSQSINEKEPENIQEITHENNTPKNDTISNNTNANKNDEFKEISTQKEKKVKSSKSSTFKELPPKVYTPSHEKVEAQEQVNAQEVKTQETEKNEQFSYEDATLQENKIKDVSKLNDVSIGQMGDFEEEPKKKPDTKVNGYNLEELLKVSEGQMGIWNEVEEILDEDIAKNGVVAEQKEQKIEEASKAEDKKQEFNKSLKVSVQKDGDKTTLSAHGIAKPGEQSNNIDQQILNLEAQKVQALRKKDYEKVSELNDKIAKLANQKAEEDKKNGIWYSNDYSK